MSTKEKVSEILKSVKPTKDLSTINDIIEGGYLDSFELMLLISTLTEEFKIEISFEEIIPDNFNSADAIANMVDRLLESKA